MPSYLITILKYTCFVAYQEYIPTDIQQQLSSGREFVHQLEESCGRLRDVAERTVNRLVQYATDMQTVSTELRSLANLNNQTTTWATGRSTTWSHLKKGFHSVSGEFATLSDRAASQVCILPVSACR